MPNKIHVIDGKKKCGRCSVVKCVSSFNRCKYSANGYRSQCISCMADERARLKDHYKEWRTSDDKKEWYRNYRRENSDPVITKARNQVSQAIATGRLLRMPCETCGEHKSEAHHDDYSKPLSVRWLCKKHHNEHHSRLRIEQRVII